MVEFSLRQGGNWLRSMRLWCLPSSALFRDALGVILQKSLDRSKKRLMTHQWMILMSCLHFKYLWGGAVNRDQIRDATNLMGHIVPALTGIMLNERPELTGRPCFPVVD